MTGRYALYAVLGVLIFGILIYIVLSTKDHTTVPQVESKENFQAVERYKINNIPEFIQQIDRVIAAYRASDDYTQDRRVIPRNVVTFNNAYKDNNSNFNNTTLNAANTTINSITEERVNTAVLYATNMLEKTSSIFSIEQNFNSIKSLSNIKFFKLSLMPDNNTIPGEVKFSVKYNLFGTIQEDRNANYSFNINTTVYTVYKFSIDNTFFNSFLTDRAFSPKSIDSNGVRIYTSLDEYIGWWRLVKNGSYQINNSILTPSTQGDYLSKYDYMNLSYTNGENINYNISNVLTSDTLFYIDVNEKEIINNNNIYPIKHISGKYVNIKSNGQLYVDSTKGSMTFKLVITDINNINTKKAYINGVFRDIYLSGNDKNEVYLDSNPSYNNIKTVFDLGTITFRRYSVADFSGGTYVNDIKLSRNFGSDGIASLNYNKFIIKRIPTQIENITIIIENIKAARISSERALSDYKTWYMAKIFKGSLVNNALCSSFPPAARSIIIKMPSLSEYLSYRITPLFYAYTQYKNITLDSLSNMSLTEKNNIISEYTTNKLGGITSEEAQFFNILRDSSIYSSITSFNITQLILVDNNNIIIPNSELIYSGEINPVIFDRTSLSTPESMGNFYRFSNSLTISFKTNKTVAYVGFILTNIPEVRNTYIQIILNDDMNKVIFNNIKPHILGITNTISLCNIESQQPVVADAVFLADTPVDMYMNFCAQKQNAFRPLSGSFSNFGNETITVGTNSTPLIGAKVTSSQDQLNMSLELCSRLNLSQTELPRRSFTINSAPELWRTYNGNTPTYTYISVPGSTRIQMQGGNDRENIINNISGERQLTYEENLEEFMRVKLWDLSYHFRNSPIVSCRSELKEENFNGAFIEVEDINNNNSNNAVCNSSVTPNILQYLPRPTRENITSWFYNRHKRLIQYKFRNESAESIATRKAAVQEMTITPPFDYSKSVILDSIAQQFYELLGGRYTMTYIYDISTIGTTQFDLRFDVAKHKFSLTVDEKIKTLTEDYRRNLAEAQTQLTANMVLDMRSKYYDELELLQAEQDANIDWEAFTGMVGKFFYRKINNEKIEITGFTLEDSAATSFFPDKNGGLTVMYPVNGVLQRNSEGAVNSTPYTVYTLNRADTLDFTSHRQQILTMFDYMEAAAYDLSGALMNAPNDPWDLSGEIKVTEVLGAVQVGPYQCIMEWKEDIIDPKTNEPYVAKTGIDPLTGVSYPQKQGITRRALITYKKNETDWYANTTYFSAEGFLFLTSRTLDACVFRPEDYRYTFPDLVGKTDAEVEAYYKSWGLREGLSPCPITNPGAIFRIDQYKAANTTVTGDDNTVLSYYKNTGVGAKQAVIKATTLTLYPQPRKIPYVLPAEYGLDTADGLCQPTSCSNPTILASLVKQYNEDKDSSGNILRVLKATTPSPYQCDLEVWMDMVSKEGGVQIPAVKQGPIQTKISMYVGLDKRTCDFFYGGIGKEGDPSSVISRSSALAEPVDYAKNVKEEQAGAIQYAFDTVGSLAATAFNTIKDYLKEYRLSSFAAVGDLTTLDGCPQKKCTDPFLMDAFIRKYEDNNWQYSRIKQILRAGTYDGFTCDYTYEIEPVGLDGNGRPATIPIITTRGSRVKLQKEPGSTCGFRPISEEPVYPSPSWDQIRDFSNKEFDRSNEFDVVATPYINRRAIRYVDCIGAKALNEIAKFDTDIMSINAIKNANVNQCVAEVNTFNNTVKRWVYTFNIDENNEYTVVPKLEGQILTNREEGDAPVIECAALKEVYLVNRLNSYLDYSNAKDGTDVCKAYGGLHATQSNITETFNKGASFKYNNMIIYGLAQDGKNYALNYTSTNNTPQTGILSNMNKWVAKGFLCYGVKPARGGDIEVPFNSRYWSIGTLEKTNNLCVERISNKQIGPPRIPVCYGQNALGVLDKLYVGRTRNICYKGCATGLFDYGFVCASKEVDPESINLEGANVRRNTSVSFKNVIPENLLPTKDCSGNPINVCNDPSGNLIQYFDCSMNLIPCNTCSVTEIDCSVDGKTTFDPIEGIEFFYQRVYALEKVDRQTCKVKVLNAIEDKTAPTYGDIWKYFRFYQEYSPDCTIKLSKIDPIGCTNSLQCPATIDAINGISFNGETIYACKRVDGNTLEVQVLPKEKAVLANSYEEIYKRMRFEQNPRDCVFYYKGLTPLPCMKSVNCFLADTDRVNGVDFFGLKSFGADQVDNKTCRIKVMSDAAIATAPATITAGDINRTVNFRTDIGTCAVQKVEDIRADCVKPDFTVPNGIDPIAGVDLYGVRVYDARQIGPMLVEARVLSYAEAVNTLSYATTYKIIRFKYDRNCKIVEDVRFNSANSSTINLTTIITPNPPVVQELSATPPDLTTPVGALFSTEYDSMMKFSITNTTLMKQMMEITRAYIVENKPDWYLGMFITFGKEPNGAMIYRVSMAIKYTIQETDYNNTHWVYRYESNAREKGAYLRVIFRRDSITNAPVVQSVTMLPIRSDASAANTAFPPGVTENLITNPPSPNKNLDVIGASPKYVSKYTGSTGEYAKMHTFTPTNSTIRASLIRAIRDFSSKSTSQKVGKILAYSQHAGGPTNDIVIFKAEYGGIDADGYYTSYYKQETDIVMKTKNISVVFKKLNGPDADPVVLSITPDVNTTFNFTLMDDGESLNNTILNLGQDEYDALRTFIANNPRRRIGRLFQYQNSTITPTQFRIIYKAEYAEIDENGYYTSCYVNPTLATLQVDYKVPFTPDKPLVVTDVKLISNNAAFTDISPPNGTSIYFPFNIGVLINYPNNGSKSISQPDIGKPAYDALISFMPTSPVNPLTGNRRLMGVIHSVVYENNVTLLTPTQFRVLYKIQYAEVDSDGFYIIFNNNQIVQVDYRLPSRAEDPILVKNFELLSTTTFSFRNLTGNSTDDLRPYGTALATPANNITRFKEIRFIITKIRSGTNLQLYRFQLFNQGVALNPSTYIVRDTATSTAISLFISNKDPNTGDSVPLLRKTVTTAPSLAAPIILYIVPTDPNSYIDADAFSFTTGTSTSADPTQWLILGTANMTSRFHRLLAGTSTINTPKNVTSFSSGFAPVTATYPAPPNIYYRYPITYFAGVSAPSNITPLPEFTDRPYTFAECGLAVNDVRIIRYVSDLVFNEISRLMPSGFDSNELFVNRYYLKGVDTYRLSQTEDIAEITYRPIIQKVNADYSIIDNIRSTSTPLSSFFTGGIFPGVRLIFALKRDCSPVPINGGGRGEIVTSYTASITYSFNTLVQLSTPVTENLPFGWSGISFQKINGYTKYSGYRINNIGKLSITRYIEDNTGTEKDITLNATTDYTVSDNGAAMVCAATDSCLGFVQTGASAGFFHGVPRADTTLSIGVANLNTFIKNGFIIFTSLRILVQEIRTPGTTADRIRFKGIKFYANNTEAVLNPLVLTKTNTNFGTWPYYQQAIVAFNSAGLVTGDIYSNEGSELNANYLTTSTEVAGVVPKFRQMIILRFQNPVIANKYSIITNNTNTAFDMKKWVVEYSVGNTLTTTVTGTNPITTFVTWHNMSTNTEDLPTTRKTEVIFTPGTNTRQVVEAEVSRTLETSRYTDLVFVREAARIIYEQYSQTIYGADFSITNKYIRRCFLKGIRANRIDHLGGNRSVMYVNPEIQRVDSETVVPSIIADTASSILIKIYFTLAENNSIQIETARTVVITKYDWVGQNTGSAPVAIPLTAVSIQPTFSIGQAPFGWGGINNIYSLASGYGLASTPTAFTITQTDYINSSIQDPRAPITVDSTISKPSQDFVFESLSEEDDIYGFEYDTTTNTGTYFRLSDNPTFIVNPSKTIYLAGGDRFIKFLQVQVSAIRGGNSITSVNIGKILLYNNNTLVSSGINYKITNESVSLTGANIWNTRFTKKALFDLTTRQGLFWPVSGQSLTFTVEFENPILVNRYTMMTGLENSNSDPIRWTMSTKMGQADSFHIWDNTVQTTAQTPPTTRLTEFYSFGGSGTLTRATETDPLKTFFSNKTLFRTFSFDTGGIITFLTNILYQEIGLNGGSLDRPLVNRALLANISNERWISIEYTETGIEIILNPNIYYYNTSFVLFRNTDLNVYFRIIAPLLTSGQITPQIRQSSISILNITDIDSGAFNEYSNIIKRTATATPNVTDPLYPMPDTWDGTGKKVVPGGSANLFYFPNQTTIFSTLSFNGLSGINALAPSGFSFSLDGTIMRETLDTSIINATTDRNVLARISLGIRNCIGFAIDTTNNTVNFLSSTSSSQTISYGNNLTNVVPRTIVLRRDYILFNQIVLSNMNNNSFAETSLQFSSLRFYLRNTRITIGSASSAIHTPGQNQTAVTVPTNAINNGATITYTNTSWRNFGTITLTFPTYYIVDSYAFVHSNINRAPTEWRITFRRTTDSFSVFDSTDRSQSPPGVNVEYPRRFIVPTLNSLAVEGFTSNINTTVTEGLTIGAAASLQQLAIPPPPVAQKPLPSIQYIRFQPTALINPNRRGIRLGKLAFFGPNGLITNVKGAAISTLNGTDRLFERGGSPTAAAVFDYHSLESEWMDSGLGTLLIALSEPTQLHAFALLTGSDPGAAPNQWRLEGSTDGQNWIPLHVQTGSPATLPTTPFSQSLVYPFDPRKAPYRIPALFELTLAQAGRRCDDPTLLEEVHHEMATAAQPSLFNPIEVASITASQCEYRQADHTRVRVAFKTDLTGSSSVKSLEIVGTPRPQSPPEEDMWLGRPEPARYAVAPPYSPSPLAERGFGSSGSNRGSEQQISSLQEVFTLPLKQADGFLDATLEKVGINPEEIKFVRFRAIKVRGGGTGPVALGAFSLWTGPTANPRQIDLSRRAKASNPMGTWKGGIEDILEDKAGSAAGFKDRSGTGTLVIAMQQPIAVTGFSWKTPLERGTESADPVRWKLEGSHNGTYWFTLHEQTRDYATPLERGWRAPLFRFNGEAPLFR